MSAGAQIAFIDQRLTYVLPWLGLWKATAGNRSGGLENVVDVALIALSSPSCRPSSGKAVKNLQVGLL